MKASWEIIEKNKGILEVEVEEEKVAQALDKAFKKVVKNVTVPGFRKGKVPRHIFEARFGVESLYQDALDILLPEAYMEAVEQTEIEPIDRPEIDIEQFGKGKTLKFKAEVLVKPEVQLGQYKGLEVPKADDTVSDEELEQELKRLQERHAELVVVEDENGAIENGDITIIDFEGMVDGEPFEGGKAEKYVLEIGSGSLIPGFEEQLVGMKKGEEKEIRVTFPENYHSENLAGKEAVFKVKLHDIKRKNLPALDDEFAKDVSEFETLDEFKEDLKKRLGERKRAENQRAKENAVVEKAAANAQVDIPPVMIENEIENMIQDFANRLRLQGMTLELYYQFTGQTEEQIKEKMRPDAEKRVLNRLVLEAIAKAENIKATEEDVRSELEKLANVYKKSVEEIRNLLSANGNLKTLEKDIQIRKAVEFLVENSKETEPEAV